MRIWYQSFASFDHLTFYSEALKEQLSGLTRDDLDIKVEGTSMGGLGDQFRYLEFADTDEIIQNAVKAYREGFDVYAIGNILDPGIHEAREIVPIPVLGLCETAMHVACMMGRNFALVTINEKFIARLEENVERAGLSSRLAGVETMDLHIPDLDRAYKDPEYQKETIEQFKSAARAISKKRAEVIIPAGGVMMAFLHKVGLHQVDNVPILNGVHILVRMAEAVGRFYKTTGTFTSRRLKYAPINEKVRAESVGRYDLDFLSGILE